MKKIDFKKDILPHLVAIAVFITITVLFFQPVFFDGMKVSQGDIDQWAGGAKELLDHREATGEEGLWARSIFGGMPAYFVSTKWDSGLILGANWVFGLGMPRPISFFTTGLLCAYIMLLCFRVRPYLAIIGAIAIAFSSYNIIGLTAGHNARVHTVVFMPLVIGAVHLCYQRFKWLGLGLTAIALALQMRPNHLQITYYLALIIGIYVLAQLISAARTKKWKGFVRGTVMVGIASLIAVGTFWGKFTTGLEMSKFSNRGPSELTLDTEATVDKTGMSKTYAFQYSNGITDPMTLFIPNFLGGAGPFGEDSELVEELESRGVDPNTINSYRYGIRTYHGSESPTTYYAGAIMVFLFVLGCFIVDRKYVIWLLIVTALGIMLSYGRNLEAFNYFLFDYLPGYDKFRSVSFTMIMPIISISLLGMLALEKLMTLKLSEIKKPLYISLVLTAGMVLVFAVLSGAFDYSTSFDAQLPDFLKSAVEDDRQALLQTDSFRAFAFIALFAGAMYLFKTEKFNRTLLLVVIIALPAMDTLLISSRFISDANYQRKRSSQLFTPSQADQYILANTQAGDRVFNVTRPFYDAISAYHHHIINGYNAVRLKRYQEVIDNILLEENSGLVSNLQSGNGDMSPFNMMNMLNTRFIIYNPNSAQGVLTNSQAAGSAWFVDEVKAVSSANEEFISTKALRFPKEAAVINTSKFELAVREYSSDGSISLAEYTPGYWRYKSSNPADGLAVFSEVYYPKDFEVTIDGQPVEMLNANYILRALEVPAGEHTIEFRFNPGMYKSGKIIMQISFVLALMIFGYSVFTILKSAPEPTASKA